MNTTIAEMLPAVRGLAASMPEHKDVHWLYNDEIGESSDASYCYDCAVKVCNMLISYDTDALYADKSSEHPRWNTHQVYVEGLGPVEGSVQCCELCGAHLKVSLLPFGVEQELRHLESCESLDLWCCFLQVLEALQWSGTDELHRRVIVLWNKHVA